MNCSNFINIIIVYCINVYMYVYNVLLTNPCNMYEIKILLMIKRLICCCFSPFSSCNSSRSIEVSKMLDERDN